MKGKSDDDQNSSQILSLEMRNMLEGNISHTANQPASQ
jgi:hypothetical protein